MSTNFLLVTLTIFFLSHAQFSTCPASDALQIAQSKHLIIQILSPYHQEETFLYNKASIFSVTTTLSQLSLTVRQV